jgi:ABC-type uncharacterized transport system involved in gliding motility auxiliary subunit
MQITTKTYYQIRLQNTIFLIFLFIAFGLIAWISTRHSTEFDWTHSHRHTLSTASRELLTQFSGPITITVYASMSEEVRRPIKNLIQRYQREKSDISLHFIDPYTVPDKFRELGLRSDGALLIDYQQRTERVQEAPQRLTEQDITFALERLVRNENHQIVFLQGHGERNPYLSTDASVSKWTQALIKRGFKIQTINFAQQPYLPEETRILIIASPQSQLLPGETAMINEYVENGGNLLWLLDMNQLWGLESLAQKFALTVEPGILVDPVTQFFQIDNPTMVSITTEGYAYHPITEGLDKYLTLFPQAHGLKIETTTPENDVWEAIPLLTTNAQVWSETSKLEGTIKYEPETDIGGPLNIAFALIRDFSPEPELDPEKLDALKEKPASESDAEAVEKETKESAETDEKASETLSLQEIEELDNLGFENPADKILDLEEETEEEIDEGEPVFVEQRVIIVGESDFLSNAFLHYGGNLELSLKIIDWLAQEDNLIHIPAKKALDLKLNLSPNTVIFLGTFFLFLLPLTLISIGISIWLQRRKA